MNKESGAKRAHALIFARKCLKADVVRVGLSLTLEECEGATDTFHRQGPRLWGFWCAAMDARKKQNLPVPSPWSLK